MRKNKLFCRCGHEKERHTAFEMPNIVCMGCWFDIMEKDKFPSSKKAWHEFKLDNLKYLESLYKKRKNK